MQYNFTCTNFTLSCGFPAPCSQLQLHVQRIWQNSANVLSDARGNCTVPRSELTAPVFTEQFGNPFLNFPDKCDKVAPKKKAFQL